VVYFFRIVKPKIQAGADSDFQYPAPGQGYHLLALSRESLMAADKIRDPWRNKFF